MKRTWLESFGRFWNAEEVPRWFGLSLVLLYLIGLGAIGHMGIEQARSDAATQYRNGSEYGVRLLSARLSAVAEGRSDEDPVRLFQRHLREFAANIATVDLRVVDDLRHVVASTAASEIGTSLKAPFRQNHSSSAGVDGNGLGKNRAAENRYVRLPVGKVTQAEGAQASVARTFFLEAVLPQEPPRSADLADHADMLVMVLVVCGALFALYRCLRTKLRSASLITHRLQTSADSLERDASSLRISDAADAASITWNRLIELVSDLQKEVGRARANGELSLAFKRSVGGALAEALHAIPDGIIYLVDEGRVDYANATACHLLGWEVDEAKDTTLDEADAQGAGGKVLEVIRSARDGQGRFEATNQLVEIEGSDNAFRVWVNPLTGTRHRGGCVVVVRDVSQQVRSEKVREEFVTQVTHELRTPLTNIRAYAETLSSGMFEDPKVITECYNVITKETRRLSRLIEDILSVSQMEVGSVELHVDDVDLAALLSEGVRDVRGLADEKNIDLQLVLPSKLEPIRGDRDKLAVVVNNVLGNAIKYTQADGIVIVGCRMAEDEVAITVKDNGIGVDPKEHARIFEKFQRASDADVQSETGTGIGLYTAREIVRRHGGDIDLISEKGEGSTFVVRLPHTGSRAQAKTVAQEVQNRG